MRISVLTLTNAMIGTATKPDILMHSQLFTRSSNNRQLQQHWLFCVCHNKWTFS